MSLCQMELDGYQTVDKVFGHLVKVSDGVSLEAPQVENEKLSADGIFLHFGLLNLQTVLSLL